MTIADIGLPCLSRIRHAEKAIEDLSEKTCATKKCARLAAVNSIERVLDSLCFTRFHIHSFWQTCAMFFERSGFLPHTRRHRPPACEIRSSMQPTKCCKTKGHSIGCVLIRSVCINFTKAISEGGQLNGSKSKGTIEKSLQTAPPSPPKGHDITNIIPRGFLRCSHIRRCHRFLPASQVSIQNESFAGVKCQGAVLLKLVLLPRQTRVESRNYGPMFKIDREEGLKK